MNRLNNILLLSMLVNGAFLVSSANAKDPHISYNYVDAGYLYLEADDAVYGADADGDGWDVKGSGAVHPNIHLFAGYSEVGLDFDVDLTMWEAGIGYNYSIADKTSLFATVAYADAKAESGSVSDDDNGYALGVGVRHMLVTDYIRASAIDGIEFLGGVDYADYGDLGEETAFSAGVLFHVNSFLGIGLEGAWGGDTTSYFAGLRFTLD